MQQIIIICLLLASVVTAAPDGRHKRHLAFIKDLITSTLFGETQSTIVEPQVEYKLYRVPGFDDVLIKASLDLPKETTRIVKPDKEVLEVQPFETYIGTENKQDTVMAFENVHNLLSTDVFNRQQTKLMEETIVPMISAVKIKENIRPFETDSKIVQPILIEKVLPNQVKVLSNSRTVNIVAEEPVKTAPVMCETLPSVLTEEDTVKLEVPMKPRYSFTQLEKSGPVTMYTQLGPKLAVRQKVEPSPILPRCLKKSIDDVVSLGVIPQPKVAINEGFFIGPHDLAVEPYPYEVNRFPSSRSHESINVLRQPTHDSMNIVTQQIGPHTPVIRYNQPKHIPASTKSVKYMHDIATGKSETVKVNNVSVVKSVKTAVKELKDAVPHYSYRQVSSNKPQVTSTLKENDKLNMINHVKNTPVLSSTPKSINYAKDNNILKNVGTASTHKPESNYVYKQISHNNPNVMHIAKEKDESDDTPLSNSPPSNSVLGKAPVIQNNVNLVKSSEHSLRGDKNETKSKHILNNTKQANNQNTNVFSIVKESDKVDADSSLPNKIQNLTPSVITGSHTKKTIDSIARTKDGSNIVKLSKSREGDQTLSQYIYKELSHNNPPAFSLFEKEDEVKSNIKPDSPLPKNYVYMPPRVDNSPPIKLDRQSDKATNVNTLAQYINRQITHHKSHSASSQEKINALKSNVYKPSVIGNVPIINAPIGNVPVAKTVVNPSKQPISKFVYKQGNVNSQSVFSMVKDGDEMKTNITTGSAPVDNTTDKIDDVKNYTADTAAPNSESRTETAKKGILGIPPLLKEHDRVSLKDNAVVVTSSSESATEAAKKGILGTPPVIKRNDKVSFKDKPIVVADLDSNYKYHQSNVDGSLLSVDGNKDGAAVNVNRGDIRK